MTGVRAWYRYTADDGAVFAFSADKTNCQLMLNVPSTGPLYQRPVSMVMRYVTYKSTPGNIVRRIPLSTNVAVGTLPATFTDIVDGGITVFKRGAITKERVIKSP
jgi:hypothetical protein